MLLALLTILEPSIAVSVCFASKSSSKSSGMVSLPTLTPIHHLCPAIRLLGRVTPSTSLRPLFTAMSASSAAPDIELCKLSLTGSRLELRVELTVQQAWDAISFMRQGYPPHRPQDMANTYRASLCGSSIRLESQLTAKEASALVLHLGRTLLAPVPTRDLSTDVPLVSRP